MKERYVCKRNVGLCILLYYITSSLYSLYWEYQLLKNIEALQPVGKKHAKCGVQLICLFFCPFYGLYWWFTRRENLEKEFSSHHCYSTGTEIVFFLFAIMFCFSITIIGIVVMAILQSNFNLLPYALSKEDIKTGVFYGPKTLYDFEDEMQSQLDLLAIFERIYLQTFDGGNEGGIVEVSFDGCKNEKSEYSYSCDYYVTVNLYISTWSDILIEHMGESFYNTFCDLFERESDRHFKCNIPAAHTMQTMLYLSDINSIGKIIRNNLYKFDSKHPDLEFLTHFNNSVAIQKFGAAIKK